MSELVWIHRFNENELGLGKRGSFCLVPVEARVIFFPDVDFSKNPEINETITLLFLDSDISCDVTYSKPPSKTEHRLSLSGFGDFIGDEASGRLIMPNKVGCFYRKGQTLYFSVVGDGSIYERLLRDFPSKGRDNNLVTRVVFESTKKESLSLEQLDSLECIQLPKPFLLLAGISGTGKTRFVRKQAEAYGVDNKNFCLVPVRPDWHEPSDLLGYVSRIGEMPKYVSTKVLAFIIDAWRAIAPNASADGMGELDLSSPPYWLCLDEMNLAPVEQYFADYLSVLESREFDGVTYQCQPLLDASVLQTKGADIQADLKLNANQNLWAFFCKNGIGLPPNLIVAGTVNMDETTHGFSRKVIDRALTIDFGEFFPNDYAKIFGEQDTPKKITYSLLTRAKREDITCKADEGGIKTIAFLTKVNETLKNTPFELAYRALNELLLHLCSFNPKDEASLQAVWDDFLMTKVLPRIDGDDDKLRVGTSSDQNLLESLERLLAVEFSEIWGEGKSRIDLFSTTPDGSEINNVACRSKNKISWMKERLERNTFTSYWP